jgi:hypothetical protein
LLWGDRLIVRGVSVGETQWHDRRHVHTLGENLWLLRLVKVSNGPFIVLFPLINTEQAIVYSLTLSHDCI